MARTIPALFEESAKKYSSNIFVWEKINGKYDGITYTQIHDKVKMFVNGLQKIGVEKGDRIALLAEGRSEWLISELSMLYLGAINVPLSVKINEPKDLYFRIKHSGARFIIVSERQASKIRQNMPDYDFVEKVIIIGSINPELPKEIAYEDIIKTTVNPEFDNDFRNLIQKISEDDVVNISYTSGTTADPKGIMLTNRNYTANVEQSSGLVEIKQTFTSLLILPWDHSFAHTVGLYTLMANGASLSVVELGKTPMETLKNIPKNIKETRPTFLLSVPALAKNFKANIEKGVKDKGPKVEKMFNIALKMAYKYNGNGFDKGKGMTVFYKPLLTLFDKILFSKIRESFGGRLDFFIGGGALLDIDLQKFFYAIGIPMYQGYGLSEAAPVISSNSPAKHKMGSSGVLVKNLELKIVDSDGNELLKGEKGEIIVRGENVMKGYWDNPKATAETLKDGWLYTGDMGYLDPDNFLYVMGRYKSLLIGNDGEKYSPEGIEEAVVQQSKYIDQIMLYNNQNAYTSALIFPNKSNINSYLSKFELKINSDEGAQKTASLIRSEIDKYLSGGEYAEMFPERWMPSAIGIISEAFTEENGMINSTMKMVRGKVVEHHDDLIKHLYTSEGKNIANQKNIDAIKKL